MTYDIFQQEMAINYKGLNSPHIQNLNLTNCVGWTGGRLLGFKHIESAYFSRYKMSSLVLGISKRLDSML